jgi:hypothetical protein
MTTQLQFSFAQPVSEEAGGRKSPVREETVEQSDLPPHVLRGRKALTFRLKTSSGVKIEVVADEVPRRFKDSRGREETVSQTAIRVLSNGSTEDGRMGVVEEFWLGEEFGECDFASVVNWLWNDAPECVGAMSSTVEIVEYIEGLIEESQSGPDLTSLSPFMKDAMSRRTDAP